MYKYTRIEIISREMREGVCVCVCVRALNIIRWRKREIGVLVLRLGGVVPWSIARVLSSLIVYVRNF